MSGKPVEVLYAAVFAYAEMHSKVKDACVRNLMHILTAQAVLKQYWCLKQTEQGQQSPHVAGRALL